MLETDTRLVGDPSGTVPVPEESALAPSISNSSNFGREDGQASTDTSAPQEGVSFKVDQPQGTGPCEARQSGSEGPAGSVTTACAQAVRTDQNATSDGQEAEASGTEYSDNEDDNQWMPGQVRDIFVGGSEAQDMIEDAHHMGLQLMAILWQADWSHLAAPARKALETLSSQHSHVMFLCLDVEGSPENTQFAFEKIMMAPTAQRRGAKPIPKAGGKWPIITIHTPPTLQSTLVFEGSEACRDLQRHLLSTAEELQPKPADASDEEDSSAQDSNLDNIDNGTDCTKQQGGGHCGQAAHVAVSRCSEWQRGALDMRDCYKEATAGHSSVVTLILDPGMSNPSHIELRKAWDQSAELHTDVVFTLLDASASEPNRALASKLAPSLKFPALLVKRFQAKSATESAHQGTSGNSESHEGQGSSSQASSGRKPAGSVQLLQAVDGATFSKTLRGLSSIEVQKLRGEGVTAGQKGTVGPSEKRSIYDPPEGALKRPGTYKSFGKRGDAIYWPRMPCLRCGCPWWLGEDWDATCVRCKWSCEHDGYDDDSRPLRKGGWAERYERFTAFLKQGKTAPWPPLPQDGAAKGQSKK